MNVEKVLDKIQDVINECRADSKPKPLYGVHSSSFFHEVCKLDKRGSFQYMTPSYGGKPRIKGIAANFSTIHLSNALNRAQELCDELNRKAGCA